MKGHPDSERQRKNIFQTEDFVSMEVNRIWRVNLLRNTNSLYQLFLRHSVAFFGAIMGPGIAGTINARLWRLKSFLTGFFHGRGASNSTKKLHLLHVPRCSGTSNRHWLTGDLEAREMVILHDHGTKVRHIRGRPYAILFRPPLERLASALKKGVSNYNDEAKRVHYTPLQLRAMEKYMVGDIETIEITIKSRIFRDRYRGYLSLNALGELTEPLESWISQREIHEYPPLIVARYDDNPAIRTELTKALGLELTERHTVNSGGRLQTNLDLSKLSKFLGRDQNICQLLEILSAR